VWQILLNGIDPFRDPSAAIYAHAPMDKEIESKNDAEFYLKVQNSVQQTSTTLAGFDHSLQLEPLQKSLVQVVHVLEATPIVRERMQNRYNRQLTCRDVDLSIDEPTTVFPAISTLNDCVSTPSAACLFLISLITTSSIAGGRQPKCKPTQYCELKLYLHWPSMT
jgi:hypothetical protein